MTQLNISYNEHIEYVLSLPQLSYFLTNVTKKTHFTKIQFLTLEWPLENKSILL